MNARPDRRQPHPVGLWELVATMHQEKVREGEESVGGDFGQPPWRWSEAAPGQAAEVLYELIGVEVVEVIGDEDGEGEDGTGE